MKSVLISIQQKWCDLIARGEKTLEVRENRPNIDTPFKCYMYCTKSPKGWFWLNSPDIRRDGVVIGEFICDRIYQYSTTDHLDGVDISMEDATRMSCLTKQKLEDYEFSAEQKDFCLYRIGLYCWHISNLVVYEKPKKLSDFKKYNRTCYYGHLGLAVPKCKDCKECQVDRPPQSWFYVETLE